jgi:hypothetical protein
MPLPAGEVRDGTHFCYAMADVDILIHPATMKHVYVVEAIPANTDTTSVLNIEHLIETKVGRVLLTNQLRNCDHCDLDMTVLEQTMGILSESGIPKL